MVKNALPVTAVEGSTELRTAPRVDRAALRTLGLYLAAGATYVAIGVFFTPFMLSWVVGFAWLQLWVWAVPAIVRRLRR